MDVVSDGNGNGRLDPGEVVTVSLCIGNAAPAFSGTVSATLAATGGVTSPSGAQSYGPVAPGTTVCRPFTFTVSATCGADLIASLQVTDTGAPGRTLTYTMSVGSPLPILSESFDGVTAPALPAGWSRGTAPTMGRRSGDIGRKPTRPCSVAGSRPAP